MDKGIYQQLVDDDATLRSTIKHAFGAVKRNGTASAIPVVVIPCGTSGIVGERGGWFTSGGTPIAHPSAYCKKGWSNAVYRTSSQELHVTEQDCCRRFVIEVLAAAATHPHVLEQSRDGVDARTAIAERKAP